MMMNSINNFKIVCNVYVILKCIYVRFYTDTIVINLSRMFSTIIVVYDTIHFNISKIRKLSGVKKKINRIFLELNSLFMWMIKIGFCKKFIIFQIFLFFFQNIH